jgi:hypothetical protein
MREAVSLMGGYGITEDCPGFLGHKWMDAQLEATYEGPEAVQRLQLSLTMTNELFLAQFKQWIVELKNISAERPGTGACALATAMKLVIDNIRPELKGYSLKTNDWPVTVTTPLGKEYNCGYVSYMD